MTEEREFTFMKVRDLGYTQKIKLAVVIAIADAKGLPPGQQKDIVMRGLDLYAEVCTLELLRAALTNDPEYEDLSKEEKAQLICAALASWAIDTGQGMRNKVEQYLTLVSVLNPKKESPKP